MTKPNVIWIYSDELRADGLGCYGNDYAEMRTPHLDAIAESGVLFRNCFTNSPVCVPARTAVLSGLYPEDTGVYHNEAFWPNYRMVTDTLPTLIPEVFAANGYTTANFGKVHIPHAFDPWQEGDPGRIGSGLAPDREHWTDSFVSRVKPRSLAGIYDPNAPYSPEQNTDRALEWLAQADGPTFTRISYLQPHTPVVPPAAFASLYLDADFPRHFRSNPEASVFERRFAEVIESQDMPEEAVFMTQVLYFGLVAWLDSQVGRIMDFLRRRGELEDTILMFGADHGVSLGEGGGRRGKHTYAPEVHRVPLLISYPRGILGGQERTNICECIDCGRTLFALAGIEPPQQFKGRDLLSQDAPEAVYATIGFGFEQSLAFPNLGSGDYIEGHGWPRRSCLRTQQYRLDKNVRLDGKPLPHGHPHEDIFLSDWAADPSEQHNLADDPAYASTVDALSAQLDAHIADSIEVPADYVIGKKAY